MVGEERDMAFLLLSVSKCDGERTTVAMELRGRARRRKASSLVDPTML